MKKMSCYFSSDLTEKVACVFTGLAFVVGILSLRCFLRSRFVAGGFFLFLSVLFSTAHKISNSRIREPSSSLRVFFLLGKGFATLMVPSLVFMHSAGFHPFWVFTGTIILISGNAALAHSAPFTVHGKNRGSYDTLVLCQLIMVPLFLLLYYTNAAVYTGFILGYPLYSIFVLVLLHATGRHLRSTLFSMVLASTSTMALGLGLLSEYLL